MIIFRILVQDKSVVSLTKNMISMENFKFARPFYFYKQHSQSPTVVMSGMENVNKDLCYQGMVHKIFGL